MKVLYYIQMFMLKKKYTPVCYKHPLSNKLPYWAAKINLILWVLSNHDLNQNDVIFSVDDPHLKEVQVLHSCLVNMQLCTVIYSPTTSWLHLKQLFHLSCALHYP